MTPLRRPWRNRRWSHTLPSSSLVDRRCPAQHQQHTRKQPMGGGAMRSKVWRPRHRRRCTLWVPLSHNVATVVLSVVHFVVHRTHDVVTLRFRHQRATRRASQLPSPRAFPLALPLFSHTLALPHFAPAAAAANTGRLPPSPSQTLSLVLCFLVQDNTVTALHTLAVSVSLVTLLVSLV
jgi:hypothetical protein